ncbi:hypothetical protein AB4Y43_08660 [Paraburkholderia sp. BR10872]
MLVDYYNAWARRDAQHGLKAPQYRRVSGLGAVEDIRARIFEALG